MGKVKIHWGAKFTDEAIGNAYGYYVHSNTLLKYTEKVADVCDEAPDSVLIISPEFYREKIPGKRNWLFTMFEGTTLPEPYVESLNKADYFLAPSNWVKGLFEKYYPSDCIFVVNHGVERDFRYVDREYPTRRPFRYLWVGAPNPRKGFEEVMMAWAQAGFARDPSVELYLKTTRIGTLERKGNVILDGRNLSREELVKLYHSSHCFLFPTRGEGFGLTLAEAMRTGLPCISPSYSGVTDFFDEEVGFPIAHKMGIGKCSFVGAPKEEYETMIAFPDLEELAMRMILVRKHFDLALIVGKRAAMRIKEKFTWERSADTLISIIKEKQEA